MVDMLVWQSIVGIDQSRKHRSNNKARQSENGKYNTFSISSQQENETIHATQVSMV